MRDQPGNRSSCGAGIGRPNGLPLTTEGDAGRVAAVPEAPSSSGVTATGEKAEDGFDWKKPKPLASSAGIRLRKDTSLASTTSDCAPRLLRDRAHRDIVRSRPRLRPRNRYQNLHPPFLSAPRSKKNVRSALINQRIGPKVRASPRRAPCAPAPRDSNRRSRRSIEMRAAAARARRAHGTARGAPNQFKRRRERELGRSRVQSSSAC